MVSIGGLYLFTDIFVPTDQKFIRELEYYENLHFTVSKSSISEFDAFWKDMLFDKYFPYTSVKVSKEELREIVSRNTTYGFDSKIFASGTGSEPDLNYDNSNFVLWTIDWPRETGKNPILYWWSPK